MNVECLWGGWFVCWCCFDFNIDEWCFFLVDNSFVFDSDDVCYCVDFERRICIYDFVGYGIGFIWVFGEGSDVDYGVFGSVFLDKIVVGIDIDYRIDGEFVGIVVNLNCECFNYGRFVIWCCLYCNFEVVGCFVVDFCIWFNFDYIGDGINDKGWVVNDFVGYFIVIWIDGVCN